MAKYKVTLDRDKCIGTASCVAVAPKFWELQDDGKIMLLESKLIEETNQWELIIETEQDLLENKEAEGVCPVDAIIVEKLED
ncbi:ferredoxin [Candidatus Woesearchaeota archaeon]|nr:ferredoxin [Candidatus Woesearchaeota archaeon]